MNDIKVRVCSPCAVSIVPERYIKEADYQASGAEPGERLELLVQENPSVWECHTVEDTDEKPESVCKKFRLTNTFTCLTCQSLSAARQGDAGDTASPPAP